MNNRLFYSGIIQLMIGELPSIKTFPKPRPLTAGENAAAIMPRIEDPASRELIKTTEDLHRAQRAIRIRDYIGGITKYNGDIEMQSIFPYSPDTERHIIEDWLTHWEEWRRSETIDAPLLDDLLSDLEISTVGYGRLSAINLEPNAQLDIIVKKYNLDHNFHDIGTGTHTESPLDPIFQPYVSFRARSHRDPPSAVSGFDDKRVIFLDENKSQAEKVREGLYSDNDPYGEFQTAVWILDSVRGQIAIEKLRSLPPATSGEIHDFIVKNEERIRDVLSSPLYSREAVAVLEVEDALARERARLAKLSKMVGIVTESSGHIAVMETISQVEENIKKLVENRIITRAKVQQKIDEYLKGFGIEKEDRIGRWQQKRKAYSQPQEVVSPNTEELKVAVREQLAVERAKVQKSIYHNPDTYFRGKVETVPLTNNLNIEETVSQEPVLRRAAARLIDTLRTRSQVNISDGTRIVEHTTDNPNEMEIVYMNSTELRNQTRIMVRYDKSTGYPRRLQITTHTNKPFEEYQYSVDFGENGLNMQTSYHPGGDGEGNIVTQTALDPDTKQVKFRYFNTVQKERVDRTFNYNSRDFGHNGDIKPRAAEKGALDVTGIMTRMTDYILMQDQRLTSIL